MSEFGPIKRPLPPKEMSFVTYVSCEWDTIRSEAKKNWDVSHRIASIDRELSKGHKDIESGVLKAGLDWELDLAVAEGHHALNTRHLNSTKANEAIKAEFWRDWARKQTELATTMSTSGINLIVAGHGTAAITSLNALVSDRGQQFQGPLLWTIFAACLGLGLVAIGKSIAIEWMATAGNSISGRLTFPTERRIGAVPRWIRRYSAKPMYLVPRFIYGSLGWFAFYVIVAGILMFNR